MEKITLQAAISMLAAVSAGNGVAVMPTQTGSVKVRSKVFYIAGLGVDLAAKNGQLIEQSTQKITGITNFDGSNKLNDGRQLLVLGVRVLFDVTAAVTPKTALWKGDAPAPFKNGELVINQNGTGDLFVNPIGPFAKYASSLSTEQEFKSVAPFLIRDKAEFSIQMLLAGNAAADQAYRVELDCLEFTESDKA